MTTPGSAPVRLRSRQVGGKHRTAAGFSLIDLLCGVTVFTISILAAVQSQSSSFAVTRASRELSTAAADVESAMESILALPTTEIPIAGSEFETLQPIARFTGLHLENEQLVATYPGYTLGGTIPNPLVVVLTLDWTDAKGRLRQLQARTAKLR